MVACGEDVGQQGKIFLMFGSLRQFEGIEVSKRDTKVLGLATSIGTHCYVAICTASEPGIYCQAKTGKASLTVLTKTTRNVERHHHTIPFTQRRDSCTNLFDDAHVFVSKNDARLSGCSPFIHVEVRTTNAGRGDMHDHIIGMLDFRVWYLLYGNFEWPFVHYCSHSLLLSRNLHRFFYKHVYIQ